MAARTQRFNEGRSHIHAAVGDPSRQAITVQGRHRGAAVEGRLATPHPRAARNGRRGGRNGHYRKLPRRGEWRSSTALKRSCPVISARLLRERPKLGTPLSLLLPHPFCHHHHRLKHTSTRRQPTNGRSLHASAAQHCRSAQPLKPHSFHDQTNQSRHQRQRRSRHYCAAMHGPFRKWAKTHRTR
jgi:hypothetical protein